MTVCVFKGAKKGTKNEENFCSFLASLFFASSFFFSSQTGVCFCVVVKNTPLNTKAERAFCGRALTVVLCACE